jgi:hypothetical protein
MQLAIQWAGRLRARGRLPAPAGTAPAGISNNVCEKPHQIINDMSLNCIDGDRIVLPNENASLVNAGSIPDNRRPRSPPFNTLRAKK